MANPEWDPFAVQNAFAEESSLIPQRQEAAMLTPSIGAPAAGMEVFGGINQAVGAAPTWKEQLTTALKSGGGSALELLKSGALATILGQMLGPESATGRGSTAVGQSLQAANLSEQYKKLFQKGPEAEIGGVESLGLAPQQVKEFYGTVLSEREKARKAPLEELKVTSEAEQAKASASHSYAQAIDIATSLGLKGEAAANQASKLAAEIDKMKAEEKKLRVEAEELPETKAIARRKERAEAVKLEAEEKLLSPGEKALAHRRKLEELAAAHPETYVIKEEGGTVWAYNKQTGKRENLGPAKEKGGAEMMNRIAKDADKVLNVYTWPAFEQSLSIKYGAKIGREKFEKMKVILGDPTIPDPLDRVAAALGTADIELAGKFLRAQTMARAIMGAGGTLEEAGATVAPILGFAKKEPAGAKLEADIKALPQAEASAVEKYLKAQKFTGQKFVDELTSLMTLSPEERHRRIGYRSTVPGAPTKAPTQAGPKESEEGSLGRYRRFLGSRRTMSERLGTKKVEE